jgi:uncharacterized membrane protein
MTIHIDAERRDLWTRRITRWLTYLMRWISGHWLLAANIILGAYAGVPFLAPLLAHTGHTRAADLIHLMFRPLCHQLPERSFFLFGQQWVYSFEELSALLGAVPTRYAGNPVLGFKVAVCQRDVAIYGMMFVAGLLFGLLRRKLKPLSLKAFGLMILPMAIDGLGQLFGLWTSTWGSRLATGALFGLGCVWLAYPHLDRGMSEVHEEMNATIKGWES